MSKAAGISRSEPLRHALQRGVYGVGRYHATQFCSHLGLRPSAKLGDMHPERQEWVLERWRSFVGELLDIKRRVRKCVVAIQLKVVRAAFRCWVARRKPHRLHSACSRRAARWRLSRLVVSVAVWNCRGVVTAFSRLCPYARDRPWQAASQHDVPR